MKCIGLDLGTTKIAGLLLEIGPSGSTAQVCNVLSQDHRAEVPAAHPWEHTQDPDRILTLARAMVGELSAAAGRIDGLCVTGQVHGILYVDSAGRAVSPLSTWLDKRAAQTHPLGGSYAEVLSAKTGLWVPPGYGAATHFFNRLNGLVPDKAVGLCALLDYVSMHLAGEKRPISDTTVAATLGLYDLQADSFDTQALQEAEVDDLAWSEVLPAGTRIGTTEDGTAVFVPIGDNQAGFLGSVRDIEQSALLNVGTGGQISVFVRQAEELPPPIETRPFPGGGFLQVGAALCSGKAYALLEEFFREVCSLFGQARPQTTLYDRMNELAQGKADSEALPLEVDTRFQGTRAASEVTGRIDHITLSNFTPSGLVRGFLRGIVEELHDYYDQITRIDPNRITAIVASGNGIRKNPALRAEVARCFGLPMLIPRRGEEAALGAALCAAVGLGEFAGYTQAGSMIEYETSGNNG